MDVSRRQALCGPYPEGGRQTRTNDAHSALRLTSICVVVASSRRRGAARGAGLLQRLDPDGAVHPVAAAGVSRGERALRQPIGGGLLRVVLQTGLGRRPPVVRADTKRGAVAWLGWGCGITWGRLGDVVARRHLTWWTRQALGGWRRGGGGRRPWHAAVAMRRLLEMGGVDGSPGF